VEVDGVVQPGPAPRFSRTPAHLGDRTPPVVSAAEVLASWGFSEDELASLRESGVVVRSGPSEHGAKSAANTA